ncbi:MAG: hypothetical protein PVJ09_00770 [Candidatus Woesebacteria bacterium]|jgi:hypothetical protein
MIKKLITILIIISVIFLNSQLVKAEQDNTDSATTETSEASPSAEANENLKDRIEKIVEEKKDKIENTLEDLSKNKKGFIGEVTRVSEETITISTTKGTNIIPLTEDLVLVKKQKKIAVDEVIVGDWLIVMGFIEDDSFVPKRIVVSAESLRPKEHIVLLGTIKSIQRNKIDFKPRSDEETLTLDLNKKTKFQDNQGEEAKQADFIEDLQCLLIGYKDEDEAVVTTIQALAPLSLDNKNEE